MARTVRRAIASVSGVLPDLKPTGRVGPDRALLQLRPLSGRRFNVGGHHLRAD